MSGRGSWWPLALSGAVLIASCGSKSRSPPLNDDQTVSRPAGSVGTKKCEDFKSLISACYDDYCASNQGPPTRFCTCWLAGMDLDTRTCACVRFDLDSLCRIFNLENIDLSRFSCGDVGSSVDDVCN
jgi:hypothetical protein